MAFICPTSKMSHAAGWRAACLGRFSNLTFHSNPDSIARGVTAGRVGSGALLGLLWCIQASSEYPMKLAMKAQTAGSFS